MGRNLRLLPGQQGTTKSSRGSEASPTYVTPSQPWIPWPTMEVRLTLQKLAEISSHGFPRVSCYGQYDSQAGNGRKWIFARFTSWPSRWPGRQWSKMVENGKKWWKIDFRGKMAENGFPRVIRHSPTTNNTNFLSLIVYQIP